MSQKNVVHINATYNLKAGKEERDDKEYKKYRRQWHENPQKDIVNKFPIHIDLENTSACNLQCPQCFQAYDETKPKRVFMDLEIFKKIIDEGQKKGLKSIKLSYRGEPLLHKQISEMIKYAKEKGIIEVAFNTNATLLTKEKSRELIDAKLDKILCSIDSHIPEIYNKIRRYNPNVEGNFKKTLENIRNLIKLKKEMKVSYPLIRISTIDMPETHAKLNDFEKFWMNEGVDGVSVIELNDYSIYKDENILISPEFTCEQPWQRLFVLADGLVTLCCGDIYQRLPLGKFLAKKEEEHYINQLKENGIKLTGNKLITEDKTIKGIKENNAIKVTHIRLTETSANSYSRADPTKEYAPIVNSIEEIWKGSLVEEVRESNRSGKTHNIPICRDCGYRKTVIRNKGLKYKIGERKEKIDVSIGRIKYMDKGIENYKD